MPRDCAVFDLRGTLGNVDHRIAEPAGEFLWVLVLLAARAPGAQRVVDLAFQPSAWLEVEGLVDRFMAHAHLGVIGEILDQGMGYLFRGPKQFQHRDDGVAQRPLGCQLTGLGPGPGLGGGPLGAVWLVSEPGVGIALDLSADGAGAAPQLPGDGPDRFPGAEHVGDHLPLLVGEVPRVDALLEVLDAQFQMHPVNEFF